MTVELRQVATDPQNKPTLLGRESTCNLLGVYTHHDHLLLVLGLNADTYFTTQMVEG